MSATNYNHRHRPSGEVISSCYTETINVGDLRDAIAEFPDDAEIILGLASNGDKLFFGGFKTRGEKVLQMKFETESDG